MRHVVASDMDPAVVHHNRSTGGGCMTHALSMPSTRWLQGTRGRRGKRQRFVPGGGHGSSVQETRRVADRGGVFAPAHAMEWRARPSGL